MPRFEVGDSRAGMTVLAVEPGNRIKDATYLVRHACCGAEIQRGHQAVYDRFQAGRGACSKCARAADDRRLRFRAGDTVGGMLLLTVSDHRVVKDRMYRVRYLCCGNERDLTHYAVNARALHAADTCGNCRRHGKAPGKAPEAPRYGITPPVWPKPPSVPGGNWVWGQHA